MNNVRMAIKIGGNQMEEAGFLSELGGVVATLSPRPVIIHGGGKEIGGLQMDLGIPYQVQSGLRVTTDPVLRVATMVLCGSVNKRLVAALVDAGAPAIGLSGVDLGLLRVVKHEHPAGDLGWVGRVVEINKVALEMLLELDVVPVIAPISLGLDGHVYNVNADHAAAAIAQAMEAAALVFVTNVPGVLLNGSVLPALSAAQARELIEAGAITGGMVPKVIAALDSVQAGVRQAIITDLAGLQAGTGTVFMGPTTNPSTSLGAGDQRPTTNTG